MNSLIGEHVRRESQSYMPSKKKRRQPIRRVNPNKPRTSTPVGGHGLPSVVKPRAKKKRMTNVQRHFAPRKR